MKNTWTALGMVLAMAAIATQARSETGDYLSATGSIDTSFDGISPAGITVSINGQPAELDDHGAFNSQVEVSPYYQMRLEGPTIHTTTQTFGIKEVYQAKCDCLKLPQVEVVARKEGRIELFFAGDAMAGRRYVEPIWGERRLIDPEAPLPDIEALLAPMRPYIESADFASVNLEIVLSDRDFGNSPPKTVTFFADPALAQALANAGFDHVTLGNNHIYDFLEEGLDSTIAAVEAAGLAWSGAGRNEDQALSASRIDVRGQPLSMLGYVGWEGRVEPNQVAEAGKGGAAFGSDTNIAASVQREAALARIAIAQYHGSREYSAEPTAESEWRMKIAVDRGAALVASHHPHVAQGLELYNGALIAYSTGNFLFDQYFLETHGSYVLRTWLENGRFIRAELIPIRVLEYRPVPAVGSMREAVLRRLQRLSEARGTQIGRSGGHGVILPGSAANTAQPVNARPASPEGLDLLRGGDFENATFGRAIDRSLKADGGSLRFTFDGTSGHHAVLELGNGSNPTTLMPSTFFRVVPGTQITVVGRISSDLPVVLTLGHQQRPSGVTRLEALENAPVVTHQSFEIPAGSRGMEFSGTFLLEPGDDGRLPPFRPVMRFETASGVRADGATVTLDDLKVLSGPPRTVEASDARSTTGAPRS